MVFSVSCGDGLSDIGDESLADPPKATVSSPDPSPEPKTKVNQNPSAVNENSPDEKLWALTRECRQEKISWTMKQGPFEVVEKPSEPAEFPVLEWVRDKPTSPPMRQIVQVFPHPKHQAGMVSDGPLALHVMYANFGDDVKFSTYHWATTSYGKLGELGWTVMVNYRPTQTEFTHWNVNRSEIIDQGTDTGFYRQRLTNLHGIDLRIPAQEFSEPGAYDVTIVQRLHFEHRAHLGATFRFTLLYGGYTMKASVCVKDALGETATDFERDLARQSRGLIAGFGRESLSDRAAMGPPDMGVWVDWSIFRSWFDKPRIIAMVPMVNFRPIGPPVYTWSGGPHSDEVLRNVVDDRGSLWVNLDGYEKKDLFLGAFPSPFLTERNLDGEVFYDVGNYSNRHSRVMSIFSHRDDSDACNALDGPCE